MKKQSIRIEIKPYRKTELANLYGISVYVLNGWLRKIEKLLGECITRMYNVNQVKIIFEAFGIPGQQIETD